MIVVALKNRTHIFKQIIWAVFVFNGVYAAECDENTPLLAHQAGSNKPWDDWGKKIDQVLTAREQVWIVSLPKDGGPYCLMCDVHEETVQVTYHWWWPERHIKHKTIEPCIHVLGDQFLRGLCVSPENIPTQMDADCGIRDVDVSHCTHDRFLSGVLRDFLCKGLRRLAQKGKVSFDDIAQPLTKDLRQVIPPRFHRLRWVISSKKDLLDAVQEETRDAISIFVVVGGHGVLKGEMERYTLLSPSDTVLSQSCLLSYKMNAVWDDLLKKYPFSHEDYQHCLNYKKKFAAAAEAFDNFFEF